METHYVFLVHPANGDVLTDTDCRLPTVLHEDVTANLHILCANVRKLIHDTYRVILLRTECEVLKSSANQSQSDYLEYTNKLLIFEIVSQESLTAPKGFLWTPKENVSRIVVQPMLPQILEFLREYEKTGLDTNMNRLHPYSRPGWFKDATSWIRTVAACHDVCVKDIQQITSKAEGCVLRAETTCGPTSYFKHVGPNVRYDEIRTILLLSKVLSDEFKSLIEVNTDRKWILMSDQGRSLAEDACLVNKNRDLFERVLTKWGQIQKQSISLADKLVESGMEMVDGERLRTMVQELISDAEWGAALSEEIAEAGMAARFNEKTANELFMRYTNFLCERASEFKIPLTLVHGDLCAVNVTLNSKDQMGFIDFGSTCISIPLRDAVYFATACDATEEDLHFYFEMWTEYESMERLKEFFRVLNGFIILESLYVLHKEYITSEQAGRISAYSHLRTFIRGSLKALGNLM